MGLQYCRWDFYIADWNSVSTPVFFEKPIFMGQGWVER